MSLAAFMQKYASELGPKALELAKKYKKPLAIGAGIAGAGVAAKAAQPAWDDFMTNQAIDSMGRKVTRGLNDTMDFAEENPMAVSAALAGAGMLGQQLGGTEGLSNIIDSFSSRKRKKKKEY